MEEESNLEMQPDVPHPSPLQVDRGNNNEEIWEENHERIKRAISNYVLMHERTPTCEQLAAETKLSRKTIQNHLKQYSLSALSREEMEQFRMLSAKVLGVVANLAIQGDLAAVKLYAQVVNKMDAKKAHKNKEPYFNVRVNKTFMWQERLNRLQPEGKEAIENILKTAAAQAESEANAIVTEEEAARNRSWENNHHAILNAMSTMINDNACMPTHTELAKATGLSRQTISAHFREFTYHPVYLAEMEQLRSMSSEIVSIVSKHAIKGNLKAAKLYFRLITDMCPTTGKNPALPDNFLLLNEMMLTQEAIDELDTGQHDIIEVILKNGPRN